MKRLALSTALGSLALAGTLNLASCENSAGSPPPSLAGDAGCGFECDAAAGDALAAKDGDLREAAPGIDSGVDGPVDATAEAEAGSLIDHVVDATNGLDTNPGTVTAPFKTIAKALSTGMPADIYLADGIFNSATQGIAAISVPDGVTIHALHADKAILVDVLLTLTGSGGIDGVALDGHTVIQASSNTGTPTLTLTGVRIRGTGGGSLALGGKVHATMTPGTLPGGIASFATGALGPIATVKGAARLDVQGGIFDGNSIDSVSSVISVQETAALRLSGVTMRNLAASSDGPCGIVSVVGSVPLTRAAVTLENGTVIDTNASNGLPLYSCGGILVGSSSSVTVDASTIAHVGVTSGYGSIYGGGSDVTVSVKNGAVLNANARGVLLSLSGGTNALTIDNASITNSTNPGGGQALYLTGPIGIEIRQLTFTGNVKGAWINEPLSLKVRSSVFTGNGGYGLQVISSAIPAIVLDLGTAASVGGNTFANNTANLVTATGGTVNAVGNTWEASTQGADAAGHYATPLQLTGVQTGANYTTNAATTLNL